MSKVFSEDRKREIGSRNLGGEEKEGILESFCQKNSAKLSEHPWGSTGCTAPTCSLCSKGIELQDCYVAHIAVLSVFYCSINNVFISLFPVIISSFFPIIKSSPPKSTHKYTIFWNGIIYLTKRIPAIWIKMRKNNKDSIFSGWVTALIHHAGYSGKWRPRTPGDHFISF